MSSSKSTVKERFKRLLTQQKQIEALTAGLQKVSAQLEASKPSPQVDETSRGEPAEVVSIKAGWSLGYVSALIPKGEQSGLRTRIGYGKRFIVRADEMLTAFVELQRAIHEFAVNLIS